MALTRYALQRSGIRANAGAGTAFAELSHLFRQAQAEDRTRREHGFVKLPVRGLPPFSIEGDTVIVRRSDGRMKAVHADSLRAYIQYIQAGRKAA